MTYFSKFITLTFVISFWTLLQAHGEISDSQVSRCAREARVLASPGTDFAWFMARPTHATLIREAPWWTSTHARAAITIELIKIPSHDHLTALSPLTALVSLYQSFSSQSERLTSEEAFTMLIAPSRLLGFVRPKKSCKSYTIDVLNIVIRSCCNNKEIYLVTLRFSNITNVLSVICLAFGPGSRMGET